jgi:orotate phosphoribosyltransferase
VITKDELKKLIYKTANIKGTFTLRSGKVSNEYFDKYLFESNPEILDAIANELKFFIKDKYDFLAGLELGGIPIATALSLKSAIPALFVRKKAKEYGTCKLVEGGEIQGKHLLIVEDVITSGGAVLDAVRELRKLGAIVKNVVCVIDREDTGRENLEKANLNLISLFTKSELTEIKYNLRRTNFVLME